MKYKEYDPYKDKFLSRMLKRQQESLRISEAHVKDKKKQIASLRRKLTLAKKRAKQE